MDLNPLISGEGQSGSYKSFTLDDISPSQWRAKIQKFYYQFQLQMARPCANLGKVFYNFALKFIGTLFEWYVALKEYRQIEFLHSKLVTDAIA